jgi:hypothetical protein
VIKACRQWYERDLAAIKPDLVVAMGATAAQSVFGKIMPINKNRGCLIDLDEGTRTLGDGAPVLSVAVAGRRDQGTRTPALRSRPQNRRRHATKIGTCGLNPANPAAVISGETSREKLTIPSATIN